jgi:hypothetical protein
MGRYWTPAEPLRQRHLGIAKSADRLVIDGQVAKVDAQAGRFSIDQARAYGVERRECAMDRAFVGDLREGAALLSTQRIDQPQRSTDTSINALRSSQSALTTQRIAK